MKSLAILGLTLAMALAGCAKFPSNGSTSNTRVHITMTVAGQIKPQYVYIVAIRWAKDDPPFDKDHGPIPVIASPWGNGMFAGRVNMYMRWDSFQFPNYQLYRVTDAIPDDAFPTDGVAYNTNSISQNPPTPIAYVDVTDGGRTLDFDLDMSQIAPSTAEISQIKNLQINFLTMDRVPTGNDSGSKFWDALGNSRSSQDINDFITVPVNRNITYTNSTYLIPGLEISGDVDDPDLDIVDWSVQVSLP